MKKKFLALLLALLMGLTLFAGCQGAEEPSEPDPLPPESSSEPEPKIVNPLTGEDGFNPDAVGKRPVAVMVSNIRASLPQWGITDADLVYEAVTEGGITRLMCMFADFEALPKIGPTRSVREYYPEFSEPFHALFVHIGGSPTGRKAIADLKIDNIDGMIFGGVNFLQDKDKVAAGIGQEHTFYTDAELLAPAVEKKGYSMEHDCPTAFHFVEPGASATLTGGTVEKATVRFSGYTTAVFEYDKATGKYLKSQYGQPHIDANNGEQVKVDNVIIVYAPTSKIGNTAALSRWA